MTNNFEKDINVPSKNNKYRLGRTKIERQQIFEDIKEMIENGFSLQNIADKYGVTRQAISLKMINCGFNVSQEVKRIKREKIKKLLEETSVNNVEKLNRKVKYYKTYNNRLRNDLTELKEKLLRKEQECEELKDKLNCCFCNPHVELNDIEKQRKCIEVTECFRRKLDQLKAENEELKKILNEGCLHNLTLMTEQRVLLQTLTEIKEIAEDFGFNGTYESYKTAIDQILQKISECEVE